MALLREQRNLIRVLQRFHRDNPTPEDTRQVAGAYFGAINELQIPRYLFNNPIFLSEEKNFAIPANDTPEFRHRRSKIGELYQSCFDSGFITPHQINVVSQKIDDSSKKLDVGVRITDRGSDLLHPLGFATIFLSKYKPVELMLGSSVVTGFLVWFFTSASTWICQFLPVIQKCHP